LLKSLRDELRSSPLLKAILIEKLQNKKEWKEVFVLKKKSVVLN
jgi:hypothetical protein